MEYTKGDWHARVIDNEWSITSDIGRIARLGKNTSKYPEAEANARLISQAPKLYEACKQILADVDRTGYGKVPHLVNMQQVIAEVEGK